MAQATAVVDDQPLTAPSSNEPQTEREAANDIENLLSDDDPEEKPDLAKPADEEEADEDDPLGLASEEDVDPKDDEAKNGSSDLKGGQFAPLSAKVKLDDGQVTTVEGLIERQKGFQRSYTQKFEEVARERETVTKEKEEVTKYSQNLQKEREFLIWFAEQNIPKPPAFPTVSAAVDPLAHLQYAEEKQKYDLMAGAYHQFVAAKTEDDKRKTGETQQQAATRGKKEVETLFEKIPMLKDEKKAKTFFDKIAKGGADYYGLNENQIAELAKQDHRNILALRDAIAFRDARARVPAVQKELANKPRTVRGSASRLTQNDQQRRALTQVTERLRKTGSLEDGVSAIEALL